MLERFKSELSILQWISTKHCRTTQSFRSIKFGQITSTFKKKPLSFRRSRPEVFCEKGVLRNFTIFTGNCLCWSPFLRMLQVRARNFTKKRNQHICFPVNIAKSLRTALFIGHLRWLLLKFKECGSHLLKLFILYNFRFVQGQNVFFLGFYQKGKICNIR